jgi:predicted alpha/beta-fold hydrolase
MASDTVFNRNERVTAGKAKPKTNNVDDHSVEEEECDLLLTPSASLDERELNKGEEESEEANRVRAYGTLDKDGDEERAIQKRPSLSRRLSEGVSRELVRRRSSIQENLPKTPSGWAFFLSSIATAILGYEVRLQSSLTCPPLVFGQTNDGPLKPIYDRLTRTKDAILARNIQPSLFVGTRSVLTSTAAYIMGGPPSTDDHIRFRQVLTMNQDGATIALDWELPPPHSDAKSAEERKEQVLNGPIQQPVILILHGINNDSSFGYVKSLQRTCSNRGWIAIGMNFRGCGGAPVTTPRGYTGAYTGDIRGVVQSISARLEEDVSLFLVGNSLGGNLVTKYLGEEGLSGTLPKCVAGGISLGNPLHIHSRNISFPWGHMLSLGARKGVLQNLRSFLPMMKSSEQFRNATGKALFASTIGEFDEAMAPIFIRNEQTYPFSVKIGYEDGEGYWHDASSYRVIRHVPVPLLLLTSQDDFLVYKGSTGKMSYSVSNPNVMVVKTKCGGHLGWHESPPDTGNVFGFGTSWADTATADFIEAVLYSRSSQTLNGDHSWLGTKYKGHKKVEAAAEAFDPPLLRAKL